MQVIVNQLSVHYSRSGSGQLVLIIPGWADVLSNWQSFITELSKSHEVIMLDLPGFGGSQQPAETWGLEEYTAFIRDFCAKLTVQPAVIIGHSNGGGIAIKGLADGVLQAKKLILLASAGVRGEASGRNRLLKVVAKGGKLAAAPLPDRLQSKLRRKLYQAAGSDMLVAEHMQETFKRVVSQDVRADAARLTLPVLLIYGTVDDQTPVSYGQKLHAAIAGSRLEIIGDADHFLYRSRQAEVLQLAVSFMDASDVR